MPLKRLFIVYFVFCTSMTCYAVTSELEITKRLLRIAPGQESDLSVALNSENWQTVDSFGVHGYDKGIYWLSIKIHSHSHQLERFVVRNLYALHDFVDFYLFDDSQLIQHWPMGDLRSDPGWVFPDKNFAIPLELAPHAQRHVYIRIEGMNSKMLKTEVINHSEMQDNIHWSRLIFGAIYGMMVIMALYNLIIGVFVRDKAYVLYACQVILFCLFIMTINGDGRYYLWRDWADFNQYAIQIFGVLYVFFIILFPWYLLKPYKQIPNIKYWFYILGAIELLFAMAVIILPSDVSMRIAVAVSALFSPVLLLTGVYLIYKKVPVAGIYTFAWSFYLVGATLVGLAAANIIEMNIFTLNGGAVGGIIEQVLLSIALAKRIHLERQETILALEKVALSESEAARQRKNFQALFERAPVGIVTLDHSGGTTSINPKGCELMGFDSPQQAIELGADFSGLFSTKQDIQMQSVLKGRITDHETVITTQNGEHKHCTITLIKRLDNDNTVYEGYITDISERKKAQAILQAMEEERMSSLEQLVTGVAHEINTPLGINLTSVSFAKDELEKVNHQLLNKSITQAGLANYIDESRSAFGLMESSIKKISELVSTFKQVSFKNIQPEKQNIQLKPYLKSIFVELLKDKPQVIFNLDIQAEEGLLVFPDLFEIILKQLIENSLIHGFENQDVGHISLLLFTHDERISMEYRDDGSGVDDALKGKIFDPFVTSNRGSANHSGLGLYRIYNLVTQVLKGDIQLLDDSGFAIRIEFDV